MPQYRQPRAKTKSDRAEGGVGLKWENAYGSLKSGGGTTSQEKANANHNCMLRLKYYRKNPWGRIKGEREKRGLMCVKQEKEQRNLITGKGKETEQEFHGRST